MRTICLFVKGNFLGNLCAFHYAHIFLIKSLLCVGGGEDSNVAFMVHDAGREVQKWHSKGGKLPSP